MQKEAKSLFTLADHSNSENDNDYKKVGAWFLGPKAENGGEFLRLLNKAVSEHIDVRLKYYEDEERYIDEEIVSAKEYQEALKRLNEKCDDLSERLKSSVPFFSQRYQGHMLWDTVMAGNLGYIMAMLYNQNNVATEASPVTSHLEYQVGQQLCKLMGFQKDDSWGHITADGTIANIEAVWAARNMKAYALAIREMLLTDKESFPDLPRPLQITTCEGTMQNIIECSDWQLLNIQQENMLNFFDVIAAEYNLKKDVLHTKLQPYLLENKGIAWYAQRYPEFSRMKIIIPATHHYSWTKASALLGLGEDSIIRVPVDRECKMDQKRLQNELDNCLRDKNPVLITVAVIGSTAEGAVDNLKEIQDYREKMRAYGLNFHLHCDAAWGGYLRTMLIDTDGTYPMELKQWRFKSDHPVYNLPLSDYAVEQYTAIPGADTLTVDPHKAGFIPYPAGALCYRDKRLREQIACNASYIHSDGEDNMGIYGLEGSKPGAAVAAVWLAHETIPLDKSGYGLILGECSYSSKLNYCNWLCMSGEVIVKDSVGSDVTYTYKVSPLIPISEYLISKDNHKCPFNSENEIIDYISKNIVGKEASEIAKDEQALYILRNVGADVLINPFVVNFAKDGVYNTELKKMNKLNELLFEEFSLSKYKEGEVLKTHPKFILMMNKLSSNEYGQAFDHMLKDWKIKCLKDPDTSDDSYSLSVLVNTVMQPWPNTLEFMDYMKKVFQEGVEKMLPKALKNN